MQIIFKGHSFCHKYYATVNFVLKHIQFLSNYLYESVKTAVIYNPLEPYLFFCILYHLPLFEFVSDLI